eukprot:Awhi_evm1s12755
MGSNAFNYNPNGQCCLKKCDKNIFSSVPTPGGWHMYISRGMDNFDYVGGSPYVVNCRHIACINLPNRDLCASWAMFHFAKHQSNAINWNTKSKVCCIQECKADTTKYYYKPLLDYTRNSEDNWQMYQYGHFFYAYGERHHKKRPGY